MNLPNWQGLEVIFSHIFCLLSCQTNRWLLINIHVVGLRIRLFLDWRSGRSTLRFPDLGTAALLAISAIRSPRVLQFLHL